MPIIINWEKTQKHFRRIFKCEKGKITCSFTNLRDGIISVPADCLRSEEESEAEQKICNRKRWQDS